MAGLWFLRKYAVHQLSSKHHRRLKMIVRHRESDGYNALEKIWHYFYARPVGCARMASVNAYSSVWTFPADIFDPLPKKALKSPDHQNCKMSKKWAFHWANRCSSRESQEMCVAQWRRQLFIEVNNKKNAHSLPLFMATLENRYFSIISRSERAHGGASTKNVCQSDRKGEHFPALDWLNSKHFLDTHLFLRLKVEGRCAMYRPGGRGGGGGDQGTHAVRFGELLRSVVTTPESFLVCLCIAAVPLLQWSSFSFSVDPASNWCIFFFVKQFSSLLSTIPCQWFTPSLLSTIPCQWFTPLTWGNKTSLLSVILWYVLFSPNAGCPTGRWGVNCSGTCNVTCVNGGVCSYFTGICECGNGWALPE